MQKHYYLISSIVFGIFGAFTAILGTDLVYCGFFRSIIRPMWNREINLSGDDFKELTDKLNDLINFLRKKNSRNQDFLEAQAQNINELATELNALKRTETITAKMATLTRLKDAIEKIQEEINCVSKPIFLIPDEEERASNILFR